MAKKYLDINVYEAAHERISYIFEEFEQIVVSFSGGKDSGVTLNLALEIATKKNMLYKLGVYHMDYEAQYQQTTDYVTKVFDGLPDQINKYWFCLPVKTQCSTSMFQTFWQPWKKEEQDIWTRQLPNDCINESNFPFDFNYEISDYDFNIKFAREISKNKKTVFLIGIRTQESLHRYKAVTKETDKNEYKSINWTTKINNNCVNAYPIYDWETEDVWTANAINGWDYNKLYDLMYQAGVPLHSMRVASPFNDAASESLKLYKAIDPNNWGKMIGRVNGVNFTGLYGGTTAMGWNSIKKPDHFTWKEYMYFLLDTLPIDLKKHYLEKLSTSMKYWTDSGGALPKKVVERLPDNIEFKNLGKPNNNRNYKREYESVRFKEYLDELDIKNHDLLPTYKRMCIAIMKNDTSCKTLGFGQTKKELEVRKNAINKYQNIL